MLNEELAQNTVWITWEIQRRNRSLSRQLGVELYEFETKYSGILRYLILSYKTIALLINKSPKLLFAQNPSVVLSLLVTIYGKLFGIRVFIDAHAVGVRPRKYLGWTTHMYKFCSGTIVTNQSDANTIKDIGGTPIIIQDPLPDFKASKKYELPAISVLFICTWAHDEPFIEVIKASKQLGDNYKIYITGNYKKCTQLNTLDISENIELLGFVTNEEFDNYLSSVDIVVDLTTLENCLVCGAYEAIAAEKPLLLSDTKALREYFTDAVCFTDNSAEDIAKKLREIGSNLEEYNDKMPELKERINKKWQSSFEDKLNIFNQL